MTAADVFGPECCDDHDWTVRVTSHADMPIRDEAHASAYCCDRDTCRAQFADWVLRVTGRTAVVLPLPVRTQ